MAQNATTFDFNSGDLEDFVRNVTGLNLIYRGKMLKALRSEDNEMVKLGVIFQEIRNREVTEDIRLMDPDFSAGFTTLFIMNGGKMEHLSN